MNHLIIEATKSTPEIYFQPQENVYRVKGISTPINAFEFYQNIVNWMNENESEIQNDAIFEFNLPYFNSATMKAILLLLDRIKTSITSGKNWTIHWFVEEEDEFMQEAAETFQSVLEIDFRIIG